MKVLMFLGLITSLCCVSAKLSATATPAMVTAQVALQDTLEIASLQGPIVLNAPKGLYDLRSSFEEGIWVISWNSPQTSVGQLLTPSFTVPVQLEFGEGQGALYISPTGQVYRKGAVRAQLQIICGPQGETCPIELSEWSNQVPQF